MPSQPPLESFLDRVTGSLGGGGFVRLVLSGPTAEAAPLQRVTGRLVEIQGLPRITLALREPRRETTRNQEPDTLVPWLRQELPARFRSACLETTEADWQLSLPEGRPARLLRHRPRRTAPPPRTHDRSRARTLDLRAADWLHALGLADREGVPLPSGADKVRQIDRYAEVLGHLVADAGWKEGSRLQAMDLGCGRGSLTFAAWQLLHRQLGLAAVVTGIDTREDLVCAAEGHARRLGLEGLSFQAGTIAEAILDAPDILIALHACNTATDDALRRGIESGSRLILVAPCCHQQLRPQLAADAPFDAPLRHGLFAERFAEWLTDALRALFLEWAGYRVKAIELVAPEHTPRNLLLAGTLSTPPFSDPGIRERIVALKAQFGIRQHPLDLLLSR